MVAFEIIHNGQIVENETVKVDVKTETEVKFQQKKGISTEWAKVTPKVFIIITYNTVVKREKLICDLLYNSNISVQNI